MRQAGWNENPSVDQGAEVLDALNAINCASLSYDEWLVYSASAKDAGIGVADWLAWCATDPSRYDERECMKHWDSFNDAAAQDVARKTIFKAANDTGWRWHGGTSTKTAIKTAAHKKQLPTFPMLDLDAIGVIFPDDPPQVDPAEQMRGQLHAMFWGDELVNTATTNEFVWFNAKRQKWEPLSPGEFAECLTFWNGMAENILDHANPEAGGWLRVNPMDGQGGSDANVTSFRHVLVECDEGLSREEQLMAYLRLNLPCSAIVDSAGKSMHAFVRVDAKDYSEYKDRVGWLYGFLACNGLMVDKANRNPARWSRLAGATRNGQVQQLMAVNTGADTWDEWRTWVDLQPTIGHATYDGKVVTMVKPDETETGESVDDPEKKPTLAIENAADFIASPIEHVPVLIDGLLHRGHVMGIVGSAGIGKSWALLELGIAIATGGWWMGYRCNRGKALLINPEIDPANLRNRLRAVTEMMSISPTELGDRLCILNLRGKSVNTSELRSMLEGQDQLDALLLDAIYMLSDAEENAAGEVKELFADLFGMAADHDASVIFSHHTGKGATGRMAAKDRARGSSVFIGAPDTLVTIDPLDVEPGTGAWNLLRTYDKDYSGGKIFATGWRLTCAKVRAWTRPKPVNIIWAWPLHVVDVTGELSECNIVGSPKSNGKKGGDKNAERAADLAEQQADALDEIIADAIKTGHSPTRAYCLDLFNQARKELGLKPIRRGTFDAYTRPGGILPHRVDQETKALYRPDQAEDSAA